MSEIVFIAFATVLIFFVRRQVNVSIQIVEKLNPFCSAWCSENLVVRNASRLKENETQCFS